MGGRQNFAPYWWQPTACPVLPFLGRAADSMVLEWSRCMSFRAVVSIAALLGYHSEALFFELKPGPPGECFKATPAQGHRLVGSYEADGPEEGGVVQILDSSGGVIWKSEDSSSKFELEVVNDGVHKLCFSSSVKENQMISFNFRNDKPMAASSGEDQEFVTKDHTDKVGEMVAKLKARAADILEQQEFAITREAVHRDTAESTNSRVMWWTIVEVISLVSLTAFQVYYLRSFFEVKTII